MLLPSLCSVTAFIHAAGLGIDLKGKFVSAFQLFCSRGTEQPFLTAMGHGLVGHGNLDK